MKKNKKYTIRISSEIHLILMELKSEYGTLENGLNKIIEQWKEIKKWKI